MNKLLKRIKADTKANKGNYEVIFFLFFFRLTSFVKEAFKKNKFGILLFPVYLVLRIFYQILNIIYVMEIPVGTRIGEGFTIYHLKGTVINVDAVIGKNVTINHFITVTDAVNIADGVVVNPLSVIVKGNIGKNAVVGAGSVVTKDVAEDMIVAGSPAKVIGSVRR